MHRHRRLATWAAAVALLTSWPAPGADAASTPVVAELPGSHQAASRPPTTRVRVDGTPYDLVLGPGRNLYYLDVSGSDQGPTYSGIVRFQPSTGRSRRYEATIAQGLQPTSLAVGGDGRIWFTDGARSRIGALTVTGPGAGTVEVIDLPGAHPVAMTRGHDGVLWFAEPGTHAVGRISARGRLDHVRLGPRARPTSVVVAPGSPEVVHVLGLDHRYRLEGAGEVTRFPRLTSARRPFVAAGRVWADDGRRSLVTIRRDGTLGRRYADPGGFAAAAGPDRTIWFSESWDGPGPHLIHVLDPRSGGISTWAVGRRTGSSYSSGGWARRGDQMWLSDPRGYLWRLG